MKRYFLPIAAALSFALGVTGGAMADGQPAKSHALKAHSPEAHGPRAQVEAVIAPAHHSLVPSFAAHPRAWLRVLRSLPVKPAHPHEAKPAHRAAEHTHAAHKHAARQHAPQRRADKPRATKARAVRQPRPKHPLRATTLSIYERTANPKVLAHQGCHAARRHENGVVVLDFGKPSFQHGGYGTLLFSGRFAPNRRITNAMFGYARGYVSCLPEGSTAAIELARGTSNYHPSVPSAYTAGVRWARETNRLGRMLARQGLDAHVESAAADDAEPAWDPAFRQTRQFFHGFRTGVHGHTLFNYGSLDGGVGAVWTARQAWYVAGGLPNTKALPEIYNSAMAEQWAELARIASGKYHRGIQFAGVMTQGTSSCNCGLRPTEAHDALAGALDAQGVGHVPLPVGGTNIVG
ncbi:MAG TPA: hypothetical protein VJV76_01930 [Gaiellaceae bacterium]|nr:hypothetical protein [Gaiellaceae bacterium]